MVLSITDDIMVLVAEAGANHLHEVGEFTWEVFIITIEVCQDEAFECGTSEEQKIWCQIHKVVTTLVRWMVDDYSSASGIVDELLQMITRFYNTGLYDY